MYVKAMFQEKVSGSWVNVESWEDSSNTITASGLEIYLVSRGTYRVTMTCSVNGEIKTATSAEKNYQFVEKLVDCLEKCLIYGHIRRFAN